MYLENSKAVFEYKNIIFITRLVEGNYPNTSSLFPKETLFEAVFNRIELVNAVDRASLFSNLDNLNNVDFQIAFSTKYLLDALKSFDSDRISFSFTGEIKPTIIKSVDDDSLVQLLLPVRVF